MAKGALIDAQLARELAGLSPGDELAGWVVISNDMVCEGVWTSNHRLVIAEENSRTFECLYDRSRTNPQELCPMDCTEQVAFKEVYDD